MPPAEPSPEEEAEPEQAEEAPAEEDEAYLTEDERIDRAVKAKLQEFDAQYQERERIIQSKKDQEVAAEKARVADAEKRFKAAEQYARQMQAERDAQQQAAWEQYWRQAQAYIENPNVPAAQKIDFQAQLIQWRYAQMQQQAQKSEMNAAMKSAALECVKRGIPLEALDMSSPEALRQSVVAHMQSAADPVRKAWDDMVSKGRVPAEIAAQVSAGEMTPLQGTRAMLAQAKPGAVKPPVPSDQSQPPVKPVPPAVTPGSVGAQPPMDVHQRIMKLGESGGQDNIAKMRRLMREARGARRKVDKRTDE